MVLVLVQVCLSVPSLLFRLMNRSGSSSILVSAITSPGYDQSVLVLSEQITSFPSQLNWCVVVVLLTLSN